MNHLPEVEKKLLNIANTPKNEASLAFSDALSDELDAIGFTPSPSRSTALGKVVGLGRTQTYRVLKGISPPSVEFLAALRDTGMSLDRLFNRVRGVEPKIVNIVIDGKAWPVVIQFAAQGAACTGAVQLRSDGMYELMQNQPGQLSPPNSLPFYSIHFVTHCPLAIVEDDPSTRELLAAQMSSAFQVVAFSDATGLLNNDGLNRFKAFLLDWRLPDMDGENLVSLIRQVSNAPVFILTGDTSASESIARILDCKNVHHVAKPADDLILIKRISHAIRQS